MRLERIELTIRAIEDDIAVAESRHGARLNPNGKYYSRRKAVRELKNALRALYLVYEALSDIPEIWEPPKDTEELTEPVTNSED